MKKKIIRLFIILLLLLGVFLGSATIYVYQVLKEVPVLLTTGEQNLRVWPVQDISFSAGSSLLEDDLKTFFLFSGDKRSWSEWKNEQIQEGILSSNGSIEKDFTIKNLLLNDCLDVYCFQHRLNFGEMPHLFWKTLIAIEDYRYLEHFGVDLWSIFRALLLDLRHFQMVQGGSTLTQQVVKNLFLGQEKTFTRKIKEIIYSIYLESHYSKEEILEVYLNESYWGVIQGIKLKGVTAASLFYLGKKPQEVTAFEASILISLLKGPQVFHPVHGAKRLRDRTLAIYKKLLEQNVISESLEKPWTEQEWQKFAENFQKREKERLSYLIWQTMGHDKENFQTYEDFVFQKKAAFLLKDLKEKLPGKDLAVKAIWGNPFEEGSGFYRYYSKTERNLALAVEEERHSVGSTLKPLLYHFFIQHGKKLSDEIDAGEISLKLRSGAWSPKEAHLVKEKKVKLSQALLDSLNRPVVRLASELGFPLIEGDLLKILPEGRLQVPLSEFPAQLLGSLELSLKEVFELYRYFLTEECRSLVSTGASLDDSILSLMADPNLTTVRNVVKGPIKELRFFGKTGTTNNGYDNWYVAYDGKLLGIIWVGLEGQREGKNLGLYGSTTAFQIYQGFVKDRGQRFHELSCDAFKP